ncbi:PE domain-containing protein [Nocardia sp. NPDC020380]|uniref:PE domain-containing protein n=1 Tax=Nocardia sp. NPDC020380 TaxID=3364309 RepID=UPI00379A4066
MSDFTTGTVRFDPTTVRSAAADLDALADRLEAALSFESPTLSPQAAGTDEVSTTAATTLHTVAASFVAQSGLGVDELRKLAAVVRDQATTFGQVEQSNQTDFLSL